MEFVRDAFAMGWRGYDMRVHYLARTGCVALCQAILGSMLLLGFISISLTQFVDQQRLGGHLIVRAFASAGESWNRHWLSMVSPIQYLGFI